MTVAKEGMHAVASINFPIKPHPSRSILPVEPRTQNPSISLSIKFPVQVRADTRRWRLAASTQSLKMPKC
jgi:hypothetical protein